MSRQPTTATGKTIVEKLGRGVSLEKDPAAGDRDNRHRGYKTDGRYLLAEERPDGRELTLDEFAEKYKLNGDLVTKLGSERFPTARAIRWIETKDIEAMELRPGDVAALKGALQDWSPKPTSTGEFSGGIGVRDLNSEGNSSRSDSRGDFFISMWERARKVTGTGSRSGSMTSIHLEGQRSGRGNEIGRTTSNRLERALAKERPHGPDLNLDQFAQKYNLNLGLQRKLKEEGFSSARAIRWITTDDIEAMGLKRGDVAALKGALEDWSPA